MRISSQLLTNELVLRFLSDPPQFSTNSPTVALLPCSEWWAIACKCWGTDIYTYIHWCIIDNLWREAWSAPTMPMSGLSLWDCDRHGELFSKFFHNLLTFFVGGWGRTLAINIWSRKLWITEKIKYRRGGDIKHVTAPWRDYQLTAHCDIEYSEILPRPPAKHSHCVHCHPLEEVRGDTGVTSINNYPDTAHRGLGRHDVTTADGCVLCPAYGRSSGGLRTRFWSEWHLIPSVILIIRTAITVTG